MKGKKSLLVTTAVISLSLLNVNPVYAQEASVHEPKEQVAPEEPVHNEPDQVLTDEQIKQLKQFVETETEETNDLKEALQFHLDEDFEQAVLKYDDHLSKLAEENEESEEPLDEELIDLVEQLKQLAEEETSWLPDGEADSSGPEDEVGGSGEGATEDEEPVEDEPVGEEPEDEQSTGEPVDDSSPEPQETEGEDLQEGEKEPEQVEPVQEEPVQTPQSEQQPAGDKEKASEQPAAQMTTFARMSRSSAEPILSEKTVNYRAKLSRSSDGINTRPWGTQGYETIRLVDDWVGKEVSVSKEATTPRATWSYVHVLGTDIEGWVDKNGLDVERILSEKSVNYRAYLKRSNDGINTKPWGTEGYETIRTVGDLVGRQVQVTKEATTQRATWAYVEVSGTDLSGWIDKAGLQHAEIYQTTHYNISFEELLQQQMANNPQTDLYGGGWKTANQDDVAYYLNPNNFVQVEVDTNSTDVKSVQVSASALNVRTLPNTSSSSKVITVVNRNDIFDVLDEENGWYKIDVNGTEGWVSGAYVAEISNTKPVALDTPYVTVDATNLNVRKGPGTNHQVLTQIQNGEVYELLGVQNGWYQIHLNGTTGWVSGSYVKTSNFINQEALQFLVLSGSSGISANDLNNELRGKGILENMGETFVEASRRYNINEIYLVSHALLETGNGTSQLAKGVVVNGVEVYNMFGIGAYDGNAVEAGSQYAYEQGWDTPEKAILGGAQWISSRYINNENYRQDTLYKMRWNPNNPGVHQYATDIGWATKQTSSLKTVIELSTKYGLTLRFDVPVYE